MTLTTSTHSAPRLLALFRRTFPFLYARPQPLDLARELSRLDELQKQRDAMQASRYPYNEFEFR